METPKTKDQIGSCSTADGGMPHMQTEYLLVLVWTPPLKAILSVKAHLAAMASSQLNSTVLFLYGSQVLQWAWTLHTSSPVRG